jgi:hypothetical protein
MHKPVAAARDSNAILLRNDHDALRLVEAADAPHALAAREVNHLERAVFERGHEQPLSDRVVCQMIDAARHARPRARVAHPGQKDAAGLLGSGPAAAFMFRLYTASKSEKEKSRSRQGDGKMARVSSGRTTLRVLGYAREVESACRFAHAGKCITEENLHQLAVSTT